MPQFLVLGSGMVGSVIAADLAADPQNTVVVADRDPDALARLPGNVEHHVLDLDRPGELETLADASTVVVGALSSAIGFATLRRVIALGRPYCDISFMAEDALELDALAKERGVCAVVDCGVAPGLSNLLAGHASKRLDPCERLEILVGGLPHERRWPFEYKAGFAPSDVIEEYTRPARIVRDGREQVVPALSELERVDIAGVGSLEAFNTDGLRSLIETLDVPNMLEKTLRYPGHAQLMEVLRELGLFGREPVTVGNQSVVPLELTSALLFPKWSFAPGEADRTVFRVRAWGQSQGHARRLEWTMVDDYDPATGWRSMSRTTGFPAAIVARMLATGQWSTPGVHPPEHLGFEPDIVSYVLDELARRGVTVHFSER